MLRLSTLALTLLLAASCASQDALSGPSGERADEGASEAPAVAGSYGLIVESTVVGCATEAGQSECKDDERDEITIRLRGLATITQDGSIVEGSLSACRVNVQTAEESYDETEYLAAKDTLAQMGTLATFSGSFEQGEAGLQIDSGLMGVLLGAELSDPVGEELPRDEDSPQAIDHDDDGKPGFSVNAPIGRVFMGARLVIDMQLSPSEDGSLQGSMGAHGFDYSVYDDSIPFVDAADKIDEALAEQGIADQSHQVTLVPGYSDCEAVLADL